MRTFAIVVVAILMAIMFNQASVSGEEGKTKPAPRKAFEIKGFHIGMKLDEAETMLKELTEKEKLGLIQTT